MAGNTHRQGATGRSRQAAAPDIRLDADDRVTANTGKPRRTAKPGKTKSRGSKPRRKGRRGNGSGIGGWLRTGFYWSLVAGIWGGIALVCLVGYYAAQLPQMSSWAVPERPPNVRIVSNDGALIANRGATGGEAMRLEEMSPYIPMAVIAIEDRRFKHHFGVDPIGLARAMATNAMSGRLVQGGSTLTQQLAKNLFLEPERTIERKVQEAVLALWLETRFSKDEILELYLNRVYFGAGAYGVDAAARRYFGKSARDVSLGEAALLAGLLKAPSRLAPTRDAEAANERAQVVLAAMLRSEAISEREASMAMAMPAGKAKHYWNGARHYVADMVMDEVKALLGEVRTDVTVDTAIDFEMQQHAGKVIADAIATHGTKRQVTQGALVAISPHGAIRALVGGREYAESQFNRAVDAKRQPGSAFKPIVYLAALEAGRTPETVRQDAPVRIGKWTPANYDREFRGPVTLSQAMAQSLNTVAAQMVMEVGPRSVVETAHRLGIRSKLQRNASIALGTSEVSLLELTTAYAPFANGGYSATPWLIQRIRDNAGKVLFERPSHAGTQVVRERELSMMNAMLTNAVAQGTGQAARLANRQVGGKTGTTQNSRDALFVGYTANLVAAIWFGNDDGTPMKNVTGGSLPARSWASFMTAAHSHVPIAALPGYWPAQTAVVPTPNPMRGRMRRHDLQPRQYAQGSEIIQSQPAPRNGPRPQSGVGGAQPDRPRSILDLLFGS